MSETQATPVAAESSSPAEATPTTTQVRDDGDSSNSAQESDFITEAEWKSLSKKKWKVPVGKDSVPMTLEEITKNTALNKVLTQRSQEAAAERKAAREEKDSVAQFIKTLQTDPTQLWELGKKLGHDMDKIAEDKIWSAIQYNKMTPEQRELADREQVIAEKEAKYRDEELKRESVEQQQLVKRYEEEISGIVEQTVKLTGQKPTTILFARAAELIQNYVNAKDSLPDPKFVAEKLRSFRNQEFTDLVGSAESVEQLVEALPEEKREEFLNKMRKYFVDTARKTSKPSQSSAPSRTNGKAAAQQKPTGIEDFFKNLGRS